MLRPGECFFFFFFFFLADVGEDSVLAWWIRSSPSNGARDVKLFFLADPQMPSGLASAPSGVQRHLQSRQAALNELCWTEMQVSQGRGMCSASGSRKRRSVCETRHMSCGLGKTRMREMGVASYVRYLVV